VTGPVPLNGATRLYGVLGHPVTHSLSPALHNAAFAAAGINAIYVPFPVAPERLSEAVAGLVAAGVGGFNLTVPHKERILPLLHSLEPEAKRIGAVNTVRIDQGRLTGTNTDGVGLLNSLRDDLNMDPGGMHVLILGAGGAARACAFALLGAGASRLSLANRTRERAQSLVADLIGHYPAARIEVVPWDALEGLAPDLLVQTTTVGMGDGRSPVTLAPLVVREAVVDIIYHPQQTPLLEQAANLGVRYTNGIGMLLHQGAAAWNFWTGQNAPVAVMRQALLQALNTRR